jgi:hypothetical protein
LRFAARKIKDHIIDWRPEYKIYELLKDIKIPTRCCIIFETYQKKFFVINTAKNKDTIDLGVCKEVSRYYFSDYLEKYERVQYIIYYDKEEKHLVKYLITFLSDYANAA